MALNYLAGIARFVPELIVCLTMITAICVESFYSRRESKRDLLFGVVFLGLVVAIGSLIPSLGLKGSSIFTHALFIDSFSSILKIVMVLSTIGVMYIGLKSQDLNKSNRGEFCILSLGALIGGMLLSSAGNMLLLYIGLETLSILSYIMASLNKESDRSAEAGLKYSLYGALASGIMLYGMGHIFGATGSIQFLEIGNYLQNSGASANFLMLPFLLFFVGLGYKIACAPFHMWSPDVYEGSPLPVTAFFSLVPKIAGLALLARVSFVFFTFENSLTIGWLALLTGISALTMTVGNVSAIGQRSVKRMLAYSSIGHAGVMMLGIISLNQEGISALVFYTITYLFMNLVAFYILSFVQDEYGNDHFERFNGLIFKYPLMAIALVIVMFSLAGIPPLSGFVAKFNIFSSIISKKYYSLAIIAGINSVISLYYYLKIVRHMVFLKNDEENCIKGFNLVNQGIIVFLTIPVVFLGIYWNKLITFAGAAKIFMAP